MYEFMKATARAAGAELGRRRASGFKTYDKPDSSLVTEADLAAEAVILDRIRQTFPRDTIFSEESGLSAEARTPGDYIWVVDPLDGTTNYANGYPFYCVSIGRGRFRQDGSIEVVSAAVLDAARDRLYYAGLGEGAYVEGKRLAVAPARDLARCFLVTGFYYHKGKALQVEVDRFGRVAAQCQSIRRDGAAALDLAMVAEGIFDAFWETGLKAWDVAAGSLLVTEAGGVVRNYADTGSKPYDLEGVGLIAGTTGTVSAIAGLL